MLRILLFTSRRYKKLAVSASAGLVLWLCCSLVVGYWLTRRARPIFAQPAPVVSWAKWEVVRLTTRDGLGLGAWYASGNEKLPTVLLLHGNRGSRQSSL